MTKQQQSSHYVHLCVTLTCFQIVFLVLLTLLHSWPLNTHSLYLVRSHQAQPQMLTLMWKKRMKMKEKKTLFLTNQPQCCLHLKVEHRLQFSRLALPRNLQVPHKSHTISNPSMSLQNRNQVSETCRLLLNKKRVVQYQVQ